MRGRCALRVVPLAVVRTAALIAAGGMTIGVSAGDGPDSLFSALSPIVCASGPASMVWDSLETGSESPIGDYSSSRGVGSKLYRATAALDRWRRSRRYGLTTRGAFFVT